MSTVEHSVQVHYTHGRLEQAILDALERAGKDIGRLTAADLAPGDEFHIGGLEATIEFADRLAAVKPIAPDMRLLDIGCGIGGPARYFAGERHCKVTGIDLTPEYVAVAAALSSRVGLADRTEFRHGSALALPFPDGRFDGAYMLHVGMNIADKSTLFHEVRRVLAPGAIFGIYDVMREKEGTLYFPLPWSSDPATSFVAGVPAYREKLRQAGFAIEKERNRRAYAIDFFRKVRARIEQSGPPVFATQIVMGPTAPVKVGNLLDAMERGLIGPTELVCRAV
ncbi:MAG: methyltransferase domain-containing protein [Alphaproteobacteria bacterium]|nr:methyltransferase domain-containing protein [Alphaproteobacteria bacterium]